MAESKTPGAGNIENIAKAGNAAIGHSGGNPSGRGDFRALRCWTPLQYRYIAAVVLLALHENRRRRTRAQL
jgi:hypothetical protein